MSNPLGTEMYEHEAQHQNRGIARSKGRVADW